MALTKLENFTFKPQIAESHIAAYFRRKLLTAKLAWMPKNKVFQGTPGKTITIPYFNKIGDAQDLVEDTAMDVDNLGGKSFQTTVKSVGKAIGITDESRIGSGATHAEWESEAHAQGGRVMAEKVDKDCWTELQKADSSDKLNTNNVGNITISSAFGLDKGINDSKVRPMRCNVREISSVLTEGFGDKRNEAIACVLHSKHYNDIETDVTAGFLKADANDPLYKVPGFIGRAGGGFFGLAFFINDNVGAGQKITITDSAGVTQKFQTYNLWIIKRHPFGFWPKQYPEVEYARDILKRNSYMSMHQWYAIKSFHKKISLDDTRVLRQEFLVNEQTA